TTTRSEAVHVPQIGFRPDDPAKTGFLSIWLGTGGGYEYAKLPAFRVVDAGTGNAVLTGMAKLAKGKDATEKLWLGKEVNYQKTAVYHLDFSALAKPGTYRVRVDGVGCSYPFTVGRDAWKKAFVTQMRGLFNNRGGPALGPPYTPFQKPRSLYPGEDTEVFETTYNVVDGGKGEAGEALSKGSTGKSVPGAWGGYHDAGDFNPRRVTHMKVTMAHLELMDVFPEYFAPIKLNIPARPGVPDVLTEALFELELFRRLQKSDGGVPYQIESNGDPSAHEVSWKQSRDNYVTAPDPHASWYYAGVAAKAAKLLAKYDPKLAATYKLSATKAMDWAERDYAKRKADGVAGKIKWEMTDARNYSALLLYDLTGEKRWHDLFLENTSLKTEGASLFQYGTAVQRDAAFLYATLPASRRSDSAMKTRAIAGLKQQAEAALNYASGNSFRLATPDAGKPMFIGFWSTPDAIELCRAHFLTGEKKYLAGAVQACAFAAGGNPSNITYTTGVGANPVKHPFHIDSRATGQAPPEGITVYGNFDWPNWPDQQWALWPMQYSLGPNCKPNAYEWPVPEAYFDIYLYPATNEFVVDAWTPNVYVWGYLAARK
ncbi:MAG: glycoside hydrolase family 9 protein, partial [Akkermansiaceae bacterium]|nr:glycoside hydrolase family 9 protein [Armatimonadota bacterium]